LRFHGALPPRRHEGEEERVQDRVLTLKDEGVIAAEQAISAALSVAAGIVNTAIGWHLLG